MSEELAIELVDVLRILAVFGGVALVVFVGGWIMAKLDEAEEKRRNGDER